LRSLGAGEIAGKGFGRWAEGPRGVKPHAPLPADIVFLADSTIPMQRLRRAAFLSQMQDCMPHQILIADQDITEIGYVQALGTHLGIRTDIAGLRLINPTDLEGCLARGIAHFSDDEARIGLIIGLDPGHVRSLCSGAFGYARDRMALAARGDFETALLKAFPARFDADISDRLDRKRPHFSASIRIYPLQAVFLLFAATVFAEWVFRVGVLAIMLVLIGLTAVMVMPVMAQAAALIAGQPAPPGARQLKDHDLPSYTILAPLHGEEAVAGRLINALSSLDYPKTRLEVLFLLEEGDHKTAFALRSRGLAPHMRILTAPRGTIRTKPRALNLGLLAARGECITVYDAEDSPHPGQLRAAAELLVAKPSIGCVQAPLLIDNAHINPLTGFFAGEYASLFLVQKPGEARLGLPVPLGGTSNHFRAATLRELGGWDARNVTEDADLGMRLYRAGHTTATIAEPTYEEAPHKLTAWFSQRRRWLKGWFQTAFVHTREPRRLFREAGWLRGLLCFWLVISNALSPLLFPISLAVLGGFALHVSLFGEELPYAELAVWIALPAVSIILSMITTALGRQRAGLPFQPMMILGVPVYLMMISAAAFLAFWDFARTPFNWRKTAHGLTERRDMLGALRQTGQSQKNPPKAGNRR
jgi:glycosyltransferase XagB